jgi:hypothetical protein
MMANSKVMSTAESKTMSADSKILNMSFRTQRRGDVEPPSGAECATASPHAR